MGLIHSRGDRLTLLVWLLTDRKSIGQWVLAFRSPVMDDIFYLMFWTRILNISTYARRDQLTWSFSITASCLVDCWLQVLGWEFGSEFVYHSLTNGCHSKSSPTRSYWLSIWALLSSTWLNGVEGWDCHSLYLAQGMLMNAHVSVHASGCNRPLFYIKCPTAALLWPLHKHVSLLTLVNL